MALRVAIAGGGLAGLTCAKYLTDAGCSVSLYEGQPYLGGRASTYRDADGQWVEQGLHLFLGVYSEFQRLLREIGRDPSQILCWSDTVRVHVADGPRATFGVNPLWAPVETALGALGNNDLLDPFAKLSLLPLVAPGVLPWAALRDGFDTTTVAGWWRQVSGHPQVMERILRPFCRAIQFTEPEDFSAFDFLGWIHHVAFALPWNHLAGYRGARDELIFQPLADWLRARGTLIETGRKLRAVLHDAEGGDPRWGRIGGLDVAGCEQIVADAYVLAVPAWAIAPVLPDALRKTGFFERIEALPVAPAISVQLWLDRDAVGTGDFTLLSGAPVPVYQDQTTNAYPWERGSRVSLLLSPADDLLDKDDAALITIALRALRASEPRARNADVVKSVVLRHPQHLIRPLPGAMRQRPGQITPVPNLFLAGDWTQQPFFGSQEGAVRGGKAAAAAVLRAFRPSLRVGWLEDAEVTQPAPPGRPPEG